MVAISCSLVQLFFLSEVFFIIEFKQTQKKDYKNTKYNENPSIFTTLSITYVPVTSYE